ncbi:MAG: nucleotidyltransferase domain-containing protein [Actinomycetota bacterium]|nr:nucleotidyltransferase domain-containing protein [Actinomycetota bacterium]
MVRVDLDGDDTNGDAIVAALRASGARFGYLHGSRNDETSRPTSDVDVAAWFGTRAPASWEVALPGNVDLLVLDTAPLYRAGRVAPQGRLLFDDEPAARVRWEADTRTVYLDERPYTEAMAREYLEAVAQRGRR